jgi:O-glycosyl hydrolase
MTETSGQADNWSGAMDLAGGIYVALYYGNASGWVFWRMAQTATWQDPIRWLISSAGRKTARFYASKNYYKYIRPGAMRVESVSDDPDVLPVAFVHNQDRTLTIVVINNASSSRTLNIAGENVPSQFTRHLSTSSKNFVNEGSSGSTGISLPASSITTLVATDYQGRPAVSVDSPRPPTQRTATAMAPGPSRFYTIDGRAAHHRDALAGGVYIERRAAAGTSATRAAVLR